MPAVPTYPDATAGATLLPAFAQCGKDTLLLKQIPSKELACAAQQCICV